MNDLQTIIEQFPISLAAKALILFLLFLFFLFTLVIFNHVRSLQKIVFINHATGSPFIKYASIIYVFLVISLFILALAIL